MATHNQLEGTKFYMEIGDGASPTEAFSFLCSIMTINRQIANEFEESKANDCADPAAVPTTKRAHRGVNHTLSVSGVYSTEEKDLIDLARSGAINNYRLHYKESAANGGEYESFAAFVGNFSVSSQDRGFVQFSCDFLIEGTPTVTDQS